MKGNAQLYKAKALQLKSGGWLYLIGTFGHNELLTGELPQLMAPTATKELIDQYYEGMVNWDEVELVGLEIFVKYDS